MRFKGLLDARTRGTKAAKRMDRIVRETRKCGTCGGVLRWRVILSMSPAWRRVLEYSDWSISSDGDGQVSVETLVDWSRSRACRRVGDHQPAMVGGAFKAL